MRRLYSLKEVADILGVSTRTVYRLVQDAEIRALKVRGSLRIEATGLEEFISRQVEAFGLENGVPNHVRS